MTKIFPIKPAPGIIILEPLDEEIEPTEVLLTNQVFGRIIRGKIVAIGENDFSTGGMEFERDWYGKIGNIAHFLHYYDEGQVDVGMIDKKKYYWVKFADMRGIVR